MSYGRIKTASSGHRHGMYRPDMTNMNFRLLHEEKRRVEKRAESLGMSLVDYVRHLIATDTRNVVLTAEDAILISERIAENEKRQAEEIRKRAASRKKA